MVGIKGSKGSKGSNGLVPTRSGSRESAPLMTTAQGSIEMTSDGVSTEDWNRVHELALDVVNAEDDTEQRKRLLACLRDLTVKYGELPSIVATEADYADDARESERLLLHAFDLALAKADLNNLKEISLSLADLYASSLYDSSAASRWLEIAATYIQSGDEIDGAEYSRIQNDIVRLNGQA